MAQSGRRDTPGSGGVAGRTGERVASEAHERKRQGMIRNLPAKTGRSLEAWLELLGQCPEASYAGRVAWLKTEHGLGHFQARLVASEARDRDEA